MINDNESVAETLKFLDSSIDNIVWMWVYNGTTNAGIYEEELTHSLQCVWEDGGQLAVLQDSVCELEKEKQMAGHPGTVFNKM